MAGFSPRRRFLASGSPGRRTAAADGCSSPKPALSRSMTLSSERTVKRLRLSKALTMPESTTVLEACRRMAARRADAALLTDSNALLCGILTDKDIATRVIAREVKMEETAVSKVMTRNPSFVLSDTLAVEALQKMVHGKFRHLPVVENGEVVAMLDIAKCLYDAISRMERASEKGKAVAAAAGGAEKYRGTPASGTPNSLIEALREQMFKPSLTKIVTANPKIVIVSPDDSVLSTTKKMLEAQASSAVVTVGSKPLGILTSRDILMRMVAKNLSPDTTAVEKVMTPNPECATVDTPIVDALRIMQDRKFLHLPVTERDGTIVSVVDVIDITHAAVSTVESSGGVGNEAAISLIQKFWDSAMAMEPLDDDSDSHSEASIKMMSDGTEAPGTCSSFPSSLAPPASFSFKLQDRRGRMHRFNCNTESLTPLITSILQRLGDDIDRNHLPQILYEDEDGDKVVLASDDDLTAAVDHARLAGWKGLRLFLDYSGTVECRKSTVPHRDVWAAAYGRVAAGAALVAGLGVMAYLRRTG